MADTPSRRVEVGVVLQGGGALGAYECGALNALLELMDEFAACLQAEAERLLPERPPGGTMTAAGIVGGIESLLYSRLCRQEYDQLESLLPSLMYFVVLPYEGHEAAAEAFAVN